MLDGQTPTIELFNATPALFAENQGQWADASVRYAFHRGGAGVAFTETGLAIRVAVPIETNSPAPEGGLPDPLRRDLPPTEYRTAALAVRFEGATTVAPAGLDRQTTLFNYFVGDQANWRSEVTTFAAVGYAGLYQGIDLEVSGDSAFLKYAFHVAPGADWRQIGVTYAGAAGPLETNAAGDLVIHTVAGDLVDRAPVAWQEIGGRRVGVAVTYQLLDADTVGFAVSGDVDPSAELVIDPVLRWATYLGGSGAGFGDDFGYGIAVDAAGNIYVAGSTEAAGWATAGAYDTTFDGDKPYGADQAVVVKLDSTGSSVLYATYLGGGTGDIAYAIAVDAAGNAYVTGITGYANWATAGAYDTTYNGGNEFSGDIFVAKLDPTGSSLLYATYLGGSNWDMGYGIAVDAAGNAYVTGYTDSAGWATAGAYDTTHNGNDDAFVAKLDPTGSSLLYATYLGGSNGDRGHSIAADAAGNAYITGCTASAGLATAGAYDTTYGGDGDVFVAKFSPTGSSLLYATYLGGSNRDAGNGIAVDSAGNAYVTGYTESAGWATAGAYDTMYGGDRDAFVAKFSPTGSSLVYSTYLGGSDGDTGYGIAVDSAGNAYVAGWTGSASLATAGAYDATYNGEGDVLLAMLSPAGSSLIYATYLGGSGTDDGYGVAVDTAGNAYVTGRTYSAGWATAGAYDTTYGGDLVDGSDVFVAAFSYAGSFGAVSIDNVTLLEGNSGTIDFVFTVSLSAVSDESISVNYSTADYTAAPGTLTFNPGETSKTITVKVNGDVWYEKDETFTITLSEPVNATLDAAKSTGTGTILNDDPPPVLSINNVRKLEGNTGTTNFFFAVTLNGLTEKVTTVHWATANGTATAALYLSDYTAASGTLTFNPGETSKTIIVKVNGDVWYEKDETFTITLSEPINATLDAAKSTGTGTIINDMDRWLVGAPPVDGVTIIGNHPEAVRSFAWADVDGDTVTPSLTGPKGYAALTFASGRLTQVTLTGTETGTSLVLRVVLWRGPDHALGDGRVRIGGIAGSGAASLGTLDLGAADVAGSIVLSGVIRTLKLGTFAGSEITLGGAPTDRLTIRVGGEMTLDSLTFGGQITTLNARNLSCQALKAYGVGTLSVSDLHAPLDIGAGGIGAINVQGGNIEGAITTEGAIGNITVTGVPFFEGNSGVVLGGSIASPEITAGAVNGKSIGNITMTGGGLNGATIHVPGSIGNIVAKSIRYKSAVQQEEVLDAYGQPRVDANGNPIMRNVTLYEYAGGGINVDLDTPGRLGNLTTSGGSLDGTIHAAGGMGNIVVASILKKRTGTFQGIACTDAESNILPGDLAAALRAEPGARAVAIGSITVTGGSFTGSATVTGKIGTITTKCYGVVDPATLTAVRVGGSIAAAEIRATAIGSVTVTGGDLACPLTADLSIGSIRVVGGDLSADLTAAQSIGTISVKALTVDATMDRFWHSCFGWIYQEYPSAYFGANLQVTIHLGRTTLGINTGARIGTITGTGVNVTVAGEVPFNPDKVQIYSRVVRYVGSCTGDVETGRILRDYCEIGGSISRSGLVLQPAP
jgi:hypothetical protein